MANLARTPKQLGSLVRRSRKRHGLSQTALSEKTGLRQATISEIEAGNAGARLDTILKVLATLALEIRIVPRSKSAATDIEDIF